MTTTCTTCPYCGVGCGVLATLNSDGSVGIEGDPNHPSNFGRLCSKGSALGETVGLEGRVLHPLVAGVRTGWDNALDLVARKFRETIEAHGPESVAFYVSGQFLTEDYYVANKIIKGYIGTGNIDTNSRLCMASSVAGHKRAFGADTVPGTYEDFENADTVVLVGSNFAWCHPVLNQRLLAAKAERGTKIVVVDPRVTATVDAADLHLPIRMGGDVALFNGLLAEIDARGLVDESYTSAYVNGVEAAIASAKEDLPLVAEKTGLSEAELQAFYDIWTGSEKVVTIYSQGVNQSSVGTDKVNSIINCHLATGRIGREGMGPFSITGQPNAMGGREVGGLANMLANHLDIENETHRDAVQSFWNSPVIAQKPGKKAVDMFDDVASGKIKAIWIMCTNPVFSMPDADAVAKALEGCDFVVASEMFHTDTTKYADVILPATGWGEKDGTVTNSERRISRQRGFMPLPGEARHDWDILSDFARRMGWDGFEYKHQSEVFEEYVRLSAVSGELGRDFDISGMEGMPFDEIEPVQWPVTKSRMGGRFFAEGGFFTPDRKGNMLPIRFRESVNAADAEYPFVINTGRIRDQWHTMSRTGLSPRLNRHIAEPFVQINPRDAQELGIYADGLVQLDSKQGRAILRAEITDKVARGSVFAPMHWTGDAASAGRVDALIAVVTDPVSGQPELKRTAVKAAPFAAKWYGFAVSAEKPYPDCAYWARARTQSGWRVELSGDESITNWEETARDWFGAADAEVVKYEDAAKGQVRVALMKDGQVLAALFIAPEPVAASRDYLADSLPDLAPLQVLAGRAGADRPDPGPTVCACFNVGINTITTAIAEKNLCTVDEIGAALHAGTNCGSCKPELATLIEKARPQIAAQ